MTADLEARITRAAKTVREVIDRLPDPPENIIAAAIAGSFMDTVPRTTEPKRRWRRVRSHG